MEDSETTGDTMRRTVGLFHGAAFLPQIATLELPGTAHTLPGGGAALIPCVTVCHMQTSGF